jgi:protein-L-isoaspartate O-methyltransferase
VIEWGQRARALTEELYRGGFLDAGWRPAFEAVPRHLFVPRFYADDTTVVDGTDPAQRDAWLDAVYFDESLVTQLAAAPGTDLLWPTSSSTMPSLMARMLGLLDVAGAAGTGDRHRYRLQRRAAQPPARRRQCHQH